MIDDEVKASSIDEYKKGIEAAKKIALENKEAEKKLAAEAVAYSISCLKIIYRIL
ncbi:hypothetical protein [Treponema sp. OMZ 788]|uniref:hypothetical protein n=1 Tax=Treponema sp. OMZ 788 TaxID=2563664 RepID=UPI0020A3091F|nr:hypothetical protein [Treponema sp. OMZ 788]